jgi:hypothetical protein
MLVPHTVPLWTAVALAHVDVPVVQDVVPVMHTLPEGLHDVPVVQAPQLPLPSQTWLAPQGVPALARPFCVQTALPDEQST